MLAHCVFMSFLMYWHNRRLSFQSSRNRRQNSDFSFSVSSNSNGKSSERTVLCVYYGTTADADVSHCESSVNHPMSWLLINMLFFFCGWVHTGLRWASWPPQHCWTGSSGRCRRRLCCRRWFISCLEKTESQKLRLLSLRIHSGTDSSSTVTICRMRFLSHNYYLGWYSQ